MTSQITSPSVISRQQRLSVYATTPPVSPATVGARVHKGSDSPHQPSVTTVTGVGLIQVIRMFTLVERSC
jgi:hypothetical protein